MAKALFTLVEIADIIKNRQGISNLKYYDVKGNVYEGQKGGSLKFLGNGFTEATNNAINDVVNEITNNIINIGGSSVVPFVAQENISGFQAVTSDGKVGDSTVIGQRNKIIGLSSTVVSTGFEGNAIGSGPVQNPVWTWVVGSKIFLNGITLSTTPPSIGFIQIIGTATISDTVDIKLGQSVLL